MSESDGCSSTGLVAAKDGEGDTGVSIFASSAMVIGVILPV